MNKRRNLLASLFAGVILTGCASVREVGTVNGVVLTDVRQRGLFTPCKTTLLGHDPEKANQVEVLAEASGPGIIPGIATGAGVAVSGFLIRPNRTTVNSSSASGSTSGNGNVTIPVAPRTGPPPHPNVPRQHPDSPGNNGQPGNGGANNPNN